MSQNFRLKSDELRQNNPTIDVRQDDEAFYRTYESSGYIRNVALTMPNGKSFTIPYVLISKIEYDPMAGAVTIINGGEKIVLNGVRLKALYYDLFFQLPLEIFITEERYNPINNEAKFIVNEIIII
jgi:hypothetical protein